LPSYSGCLIEEEGSASGPDKRYRNIYRFNITSCHASTPRKSEVNVLSAVSTIGHVNVVLFKMQSAKKTVDRSLREGVEGWCG